MKKENLYVKNQKFLFSDNLIFKIKMVNYNLSLLLLIIFFNYFKINKKLFMWRYII